MYKFARCKFPNLLSCIWWNWYRNNQVTLLFGILLSCNNISWMIGWTRCRMSNNGLNIFWWFVCRYHILEHLYDRATIYVEECSLNITCNTNSISPCFLKFSISICTGKYIIPSVYCDICHCIVKYGAIIIYNVILFSVSDELTCCVLLSTTNIIMMARAIAYSCYYTCADYICLHTSSSISWQCFCLQHVAMFVYLPTLMTYYCP